MYRVSRRPKPGDPGWKEVHPGSQYEHEPGDGRTGQWLPPGSSMVSGQKRYKTFYKTSDFLPPGPSQLWVLIDEHPDSINAGGYANMMVEARAPHGSSTTRPAIITAPAAWPSCRRACGDSQMDRPAHRAAGEILRHAAQRQFPEQQGHDLDVGAHQRSAVIPRTLQDCG